MPFSAEALEPDVTVTGLITVRTVSRPGAKLFSTTAAETPAPATAAAAMTTTFLTPFMKTPQVS